MILLLGENIISLRHRNHITQEVLANELQVSTSTIAMYESGYRLPRLDKLIRIGAFFNVSLDELVGYRVDPKREQGVIQ